MFAARLQRQAGPVWLQHRASDHHEKGEIQQTAPGSPRPQACRIARTESRDRLLGPEANFQGRVDLASPGPEGSRRAGVARCLTGR
jgi:hypothetical protein